MSAPSPQSPPNSPAMLLVLLGKRLRDEIDAGLKELGLSMRHFSALGHLDGHPGLSYSELARRAGITVQSIQSTLTQLESLGAIERRTEPGRGRTAELHVTERGRALLGKGREVVRAADERVLAAAGEDERTLNAVLGKLLRATVSAP